jgi:phosphopantothenoylcysteine decarboxylase/phosphopantothenate--cysteine ligase
MTLYVRRTGASLALCRDRAFLVASRGGPLDVSNVDLESFAHLWALLARPMAQEDLFGTAASAGLSELVELLIDEEMVIPAKTAAAEESSDATGRKPCRHLVVGVTGAIQAAQVPSSIRELHDRLSEHTEVVLTDAATRFVTAAAFESLGFRTWIDAHTPRDGINVPHMHLAASAELVVIVPASAHTLHKLATGACSDLLSLVVAATKAPVVLVPSMNSAMWENSAIRRNVVQLRQDGLFVVEPGLGLAASHREAARPVLGGPGAFGADLVRLLAVILELQRAG